MNQKLLSGLTATLLVTTLGTSASGNAESSKAADPTSETNPQIASKPAPVTTKPPAGDVVKVGEQQSRSTPQSEVESIAKVHPYEITGRKAATLYVRNLPVLTFIGSKKTAPDGIKVGTQSLELKAIPPTSSVKSLDGSVYPEVPLVDLSESLKDSKKPTTASPSPEVSKEDPVWRASELASRLNQLKRNGLDANAITVSWDTQPGTSFALGDRFLIKVNGNVLVAVDRDTILPETRSLETDALQVTNRLRQLLGNASPLPEVSDNPSRRKKELALGPVRFQLNGWASWYGPGFDGAPSASGETFNQYALTAAHRSLPFGTRVVVTNLDNGSSVVVRINDRGPYSGNRIIDLSTAAAQVLGLIQTGTAPVRLDVLDNRQMAAERN